jgi:hypothetical protein
VHPGERRRLGIILSAFRIWLDTMESRCRERGASGAVLPWAWVVFLHDAGVCMCVRARPRACAGVCVYVGVCVCNLFVWAACGCSCASVPVSVSVSLSVCGSVRGLANWCAFVIVF